MQLPRSSRFDSPAGFDAPVPFTEAVSQITQGGGAREIKRRRIRFRTEADNIRRKANKNRPEYKERQQVKLRAKHLAKSMGGAMQTNASIRHDCSVSGEGWSGRRRNDGLPAPAHTIEEAISMGYELVAWGAR